ncbi:hypothetical protein N9M10_05045, partial [Hellea sp.]|nr:hypothetical protein [Hellea sp.]
IERDYILLDDVWIVADENNGILITEEWYDTAVCAVDVFEMKISMKSAKTLLKTEHKDYSKFPTVVHTAWPNKIEEIHIIECFDSDEIIDGKNIGKRDNVRFDGALAFDMSNGQCFKLGIEASIAGRFTFEYIKSHKFYSQLREWRIRKTLTSNTLTKFN